MFTFEAGGPVSGRSGVKLCISLWLYVVLIYWRKVAWAIHKQVWLIYYPTPSATNYPGRLCPPVYCLALICHSAPICRLVRSIVPGRLCRFLRAQLANCVGRQTALNKYIHLILSANPLNYTMTPLLDKFILHKRWDISFNCFKEISSANVNFKSRQNQHKMVWQYMGIWSDTRITKNSCKATLTPLSLNVRRCLIDFGLGQLRLRPGAVAHWIVHSVCIDFSYRWLACVPLYLAIS